MTFLPAPRAVAAAVAFAFAANATLLPVAAAAERNTRTPIEHVIIIMGENHTYDNVFATYTPTSGQKTRNLLSEGIVKADGTPGPNFAAAAQQQASDTRIFELNPTQTGPYATLPQPHIAAISGVLAIPDPRLPTNLPNGPFQITHYIPYDVPYTVPYDDLANSPLSGDPPHRLFQMWQQMDEGKNDLFVWVTQTAGIGPQNTPAPTPAYTGIGGEAMGFYNMAAGDVPQFKALADTYAMADNYHQSIMGGTGANFLAIATADTAFYTGPDGKAATPPANQIENADPQPGTNNFYTQDGYGGGSYVNCADMSEGGVHAIRHYLASLPYKAFRNGNCEPGHYYLVNNYNLGYNLDGTPKALVNAAGAPLTVLPPQHFPTIADALTAKNISWKWYSGNRPGAADSDPQLRHASNGALQYDGYCGICDPFVAFASISTNPAERAKLQGLSGFDADVAKAEKNVPAVMFVRPFESKAGHPLNATMADFEGFVSGVIAKVKANPELWKKTAILITADEGGGYYDSGYVQPIDFFGDGTRIPMIAVSPFARKGYVDHTYYDHASIAKFIERNWSLKPLSNRSRDNLPNPVQNDDEDAYIPANRPAVGDLMNLFDFED
jgi:acid phosphatase